MDRFGALHRRKNHRRQTKKLRSAYADAVQLLAADPPGYGVTEEFRIKAIVESIGHVMGDTVKVNIALKNIEDMAAVDEVYTTFFPGGIPARRTVGVSALPGNALIQIDVVVSNAEGTPPKA